MSNAPTDASSATRVEFERHKCVATVRFVADKGPPLMTSPVLGELGTFAKQVAEDPCIRFVVFRSTGPVFNAGADVGPLLHLNEDQGCALARAGQHVFDAIENLPQVTFAALNGHAIGGGCELAIACSFRIAVATARLSLPEARLGLIPGWGGAKRLPMMIPLNWALRMLYAGEEIPADRAERIGLVDDVVASEADLDEALERWFSKFRKSAPQAIVRIKRAVLNNDEAHQFGLCFTGSEAKEGIRAFLEKRAPSWAADEECQDG
jgi:enoyl-CoA hydratase